MNGSIPHEPFGEAQRDVYTVTEISDAVRQHLESEFPRVSVIGEIANLKHHTSGHMYFTLRDSASMLHAVLFRRYAERIAQMPENGMLVIAPGRISHFGGSGQTQLIATDLIPAGRGNMELEFRRLLERLMDEAQVGIGHHGVLAHDVQHLDLARLGGLDHAEKRIVLRRVLFHQPAEAETDDHANKTAIVEADVLGAHLANGEAPHGAQGQE